MGQVGQVDGIFTALLKSNQQRLIGSWLYTGWSECLLSVHFLILQLKYCTIATDKALFSSEKCWYLSYFSTKTYVVGTHWKSLGEALPMSTHNICFNREINKILCGYPLLLYTHLKNWRVWRLSVRKLFCFWLTPPTVYILSSWNLVYS